MRQTHGILRLQMRRWLPMTVGVARIWCYGASLPVAWRELRQKVGLAMMVRRSLVWLYILIPTVLAVLRIRCQVVCRSSWRASIPGRTYGSGCCIGSLWLRVDHGLGRHGVGPQRSSNLPRSMLCPSRRPELRYCIWRDVSAAWVARQRPPLDPSRSRADTLSKVFNASYIFSCTFWLGPRIVICELYPQLPSIFAFVIQTLP